MRSWISAVTTAALTAGMLGAAMAPAQAADWDPASIRVTKSVTVGGVEYDLPDAPEVEIGEEFQWNLEIICDQITDQCVNATLTDLIPAEFEIVEGSINSSVSSNVTVNGQTVTIEFKEPLTLPSGQVGLSAGANVSIPVKLRPIDHSRNGEIFTNTASTVADNAPKTTDEAAVTADVALVLDAKATKKFDPESALANPGDPISLTFGGSNTSNDRVDRLVVQDPADPTANPNIFQQYLQIESLDGVSWPQGATQAVVSVTTDGTNWSSAPVVSNGGALVLPTGIDPHSIRGIRIEFTAPTPAIPTNAATSVQMALSQRASAGAITSNTTLSNVASAQTGRGPDDSPKATQVADVVLRPASTSVSASKSFDPNEIAVTGQTTESTVTLGARNTGTRSLSTLTIHEPSNPADVSADNLLAPEFPGGGVTFRGFGDVSWPQGAESVSVKYYFADETSETVSGTTADALPAPTDPAKRITGFSITFSGTEIVEGAEATVPFTVRAPTQLEPGQRIVTGTNEITVTGETPGPTPDPAPDTAEDDLTIYADQITITTEKSLTHDELWSVPGQTTTAQLKTTIAPYPKTTTNPTEVIIDDPAATTGVEPWYEYFDATAITLTQIPQNATLEIQYRDAAGNFTTISGMGSISGGANGIFSAPIPANLQETITGIRFIYRSDDGFVPGQVLRPNITFTTRATERTTGDPIPRSNADPSDDTPIAVVENCSASEASTEDLESGRVSVTPPCPDVTLKPTGTGTGPGIDKEWDPDLAFSHSRQNTSVKLNWSAGGVQGIDQIIIADPGTNPATGAPAQLGAASAYDSFDLTVIGPIADPSFAYDQVRVQLYNGAGWVDTSACTLAAPCAGTSIPAITLTTGERATTQGVRFIVTERPGRTPATVDAPLPGTGVSTGTNRTIPLTLQLRDTLRSNASIPVVEGPLYNTGTPSQVRNTGSVEGYVDGTREYRGDDSDTITITDTELGVSAAKSWAGGPVAIPQDWATQAAPTTRVTASATNQTVGGVVNGQAVPGLVNSLRIDEPGAQVPGDLRSPFEAFDLVGFQSLTAPQGTTGIRVEFTGAGAPGPVTGTTAAGTLASLQALPAGQLRAVTGYSVIYTGSLASGAQNGTGSVQFDLELRQNLRTAGTPVTTANSPVQNTVLGTVTDKRYDGTDFVDESLNDDASAQVRLEAQSISVTPGKTFTPTSETEPSRGDLTMTLSGQPGGTERAKSLVLTDDRATFWNAYDFQRIGANLSGLPTFSPAGKPIQLEFSVCTGRDFDAWEAGGADPTAGCGSFPGGGTWSAWTAPLSATAAQNWAPADPSVVQGIRIRFTRVGDAQWENPQSPKVNLPVVIKRRLDLRSGGPVPSTLNDGGSNAPGEPVKGVTTNTVAADVVGIWGGTDSDSANATITYRHAKNAVQVNKDPIGVKSPGTPFDYTLTIRNTGDRDIVDPVITDRLPWNATLGTLVQFDPDAAEGTERYAYALSGTNPVTGTPMPTAPASVQVAEDLGSSTPTIAFTFPAGTHLAPGQVYTITFKMMFVPGVVEGQPVTNGFDVSGARVWDECTAPSGRTATLSGDATKCYTEARVTPQRLPSIRAVKSVRAIGETAGTYNDHGFVDATACTGKVDGDDFAFQPCVPRTKPGQTEEWRLSVTNNGTTPMTRIAVADLLPTPGDSTLIAGFDRKSQWTPALTDDLPWLTGYAAGVLKTYATTAPKSQICMAVVNNPNDANIANCTGTTAAEAGTKFVPFTAAGLDHAEVTALLFVVEPPTGQQIAPGERLDLHFNTKTGPYSQQTTAADPKAVNSLTVSARYSDGGTIRTLNARDQSNVGIALITGSVRIAKTVTGPGAGFVPTGQTFSGSLECTSQGVQIPSRPFTVVVGTPTQIDYLPAGAVCTVTETAASGQTSYTVSAPVTVPDSRDIAATVPTLAITNTYELTQLRVTKTVQTDAEQIPSGFAFTVSCTFLGQTVPLAPGDASFTLDDGGVHVITGLPVNATCVVTETDAHGADSTQVEAESIDSAGDPWGAVVEAGDTATITGLAPVTGSNEVAFTNVFGAQAALRVEKDLVGGAADIAESKSFDIDVVCTFDGETLLDTTITLNRGNGWGETLPSLVAGAECTITEPDLNGADAVIITPNDGTDATVGVVTIPDDATEPVLIEVTNRFLAGSLEVTKAVTGDGAALYGTGDFTLTLACTLGGDPVRVIGGADRTVSAQNPTASYTGLPSGAECTLTETGAAGATESRMRLVGGPWVAAGDPGTSFTVQVDPSQASDADQEQTAIEVENRFDLAEVSVTKRVQSDAVDASGNPIGYGPFEVELTCTFEGAAVTVTDAVQSIADGGTATWTGLPAGGRCAINETATGDADSIWFEQPGTGAGSVRTDGSTLTLAPLVPLGGNAGNTADLVNRFDSTALTIVKVLDGDDADAASGKTFAVELVCTLTDASHTAGVEVWNGTLKLSASNGWKAVVPALATGAECNAVETRTGGADRTEMRIDGARIGGAQAGFTADATSITLSVVNTFRKDLVTTGGTVMLGALGGLALMALIGGAALMIAQRRRNRA